MKQMDISNSQIYDTVPGWFWNNSHIMRYLDMSFNHIRGVIPDNVLSTWILDLRSNEFSGSLPLLPPSQPIEFLSSRNKFSGEINEFCNATYEFYVLDLSDNQLSGELSKECFMKVKASHTVNLGNNNLSGEIPRPNRSFCGLKSLHLRNNSFTGHFPVSIRDCHDLGIIDLGYNYFTAEIPSWIGERFSYMNIISLRSNKFSGIMPSSMCFLVNIQVLDISMNNISGAIPKCLNNFTSMSITSPVYNIDRFRHNALSGGYFYDTTYIMWKGHEAEFARTLNLVRVIDLSSNHLEGEIPSEITSLKGLIALDLSKNHLAGSIPSDIDKLEFLNLLDLSENSLSGSISATLSSLDHLGWMNLSFNNLSGRIPWSTHSETFNSNSYWGNPQLCGPPVLRPCPGDLRSDNDTEDDLDAYITKGFYVSLAAGFILAFWGTFGILNFHKTCRSSFPRC